MSTNAKRKQDEKNVKALRELVAIATNKHCFDCDQRGPTYVNMTIGSFCCTGCSGILRGLNPPHRVKSISMASFTAEEVEFIRNRGNDECRKIWLGLYDGPVRFADSAVREDQHIKDYLIKKYERKRWYVSPSEISQQQRLMAQHSKDSSGASSTTSGISSQPNGQRSPPNLLDNSPAKNIPAPRNNKIENKTSNSLDLLSSDLFAPVVSMPQQHQPKPQQPAQLRPQQQQQPTAQFANFASFDANFPPSSNAQQPQHLLNYPPITFPTDKANIDPSAQMSKSATVPANIAPMRPLEPISANSQQIQPQQQIQVQQQPKSSGDKYSALAELDDFFHSTQTNGLSGVAGVLPLGSSPNMTWSASIPPKMQPPKSAAPMFGGESVPMGAGVTKSTTLDSFALTQNQQTAPPVNPFFAPSSNNMFSAQAAANPFASNGINSWNCQPNLFAMTPQQTNNADTVQPGLIPQQSGTNWNPFWG